jgi:hypothetical protein
MAAGGFAVIVVFELALAFGAPLGAAAWGGEHSGQLHADLHLASVVAAAFWTPLRLTVLSRGGVAASPAPFEEGLHAGSACSTTR